MGGAAVQSEVLANCALKKRGLVDRFKKTRGILINIFIFLIKVLATDEEGVESFDERLFT